MLKNEKINKKLQSNRLQDRKLNNTIKRLTKKEFIEICSGSASNVLNEVLARDPLACLAVFYGSAVLLFCLARENFMIINLF